MVTYDQLKIGQVVYFIMDDDFYHRKCIHFGTIDGIFCDGASIKLYTDKETRLVNGIPYNEFETPTPLQKLPKGWTYNTSLFKMDWEKISIDYLDEIDFLDERYINNPNNISKLIDDGWLIPIDEKDWSHIETVINKNGWYLIKKDDYEYHPSHTFFNYNDIYLTYEDAKKYIDEYEAELKRQSELTDVEWSLELIEKDVDRYLAFNYQDIKVKESKKKRIMEWFGSIENVKDIETRVLTNTIEWKYRKNKKWNAVDSNIL